MGLVGRDREHAAVSEVIRHALAGRGGAFVVRGEAGAGKSALLADVLESEAAAARVVRLSGVGAEADLGYAGLHRLVRSLTTTLGRLPARQANALAGAVGMAEVDGRPDRFLVGLATLTLLAEESGDEPLVCVVDDAQWLDPDSLGALAFAARRLAADPVAMLFATRDQHDPDDLLSGLTDTQLGGLDVDEVGRLLAGLVGTPLGAAAVARLADVSGGNPLVLIDIATELTADQLRQWADRPEPLPLTTRVEVRCRRQLDGLPAATRAYLVALAADGTGDPTVLARAAAGLGLPADPLAPAEEAGLVSAHDRVVFRHPLAGPTLYGSATAAERRRAHAALAEAYRGRDPDRRAWHLAAASEGPDEKAAAELESSGARLGARGGGRSQAELLARAAALSPDPVDRDRRVVAAARAGGLAGGQRRAIDLLSETLPSMVDPYLRAQALWLVGALLPVRRDWQSGPSRLAVAARAIDAFDRDAARSVALDAVSSCAFVGAGRGDAAIAEVVELVDSLPPADRHATGLVDALLDGFTATLAGDVAAGAPGLRNALQMWRDDPPEGNDLSRWMLLPLWAALELWEDDALAEVVARGLAHARAMSSAGAMQGLLFAQAVEAVRSGRFGAAEAANDESHTMNELVDASDDLRPIIDVELAAWRGPEAEARATADAARRASDDQDYRVGARLADLAEAVIGNAVGDHAGALAAARRAAADAYPGFTGQALAEGVEAATRVGDGGTAGAFLARLERQVAASGTALAVGVLARCRALTAGDDPAGVEALHRQAVERLATTRWATEAARARLAYGEWLRRVGRRSDARAELRAAHDAFATMGAGLFAERARAELEATGLRTLPRTGAATSELTPQERQVAGLAAGGATNGEIAERLFISPNTVDYHLRKVFQKLGVSSRRRLSAVLPP